jgi:hypothetical protein
MNRVATFFLRTVIYTAGAVILVLCTFWLPEMASSAAIQNPQYAYLRYPIQMGIYLTTIPFYLALYQSLNLLNWFRSSDPVSGRVSSSLHQIEVSGFGIAVMYLAGLLFLGWQNALHPGIALMGVALLIASLTVACFAALLRQVWTQVST